MKTYPGRVSDEENSVFPSHSKVRYITVKTARDRVRSNIPPLITAAKRGKKNRRKKTFDYILSV